MDQSVTVHQQALQDTDHLMLEGNQAATVQVGSASCWFKLQSLKVQGQHFVADAKRWQDQVHVHVHKCYSLLLHTSRQHYT